MPRCPRPNPKPIKEKPLFALYSGLDEANSGLATLALRGCFRYASAALAVPVAPRVFVGSVSRPRAESSPRRGTMTTPSLRSGSLATAQNQPCSSGGGCAGGLKLLGAPPKPTAGYALVFWGCPQHQGFSPRFLLPGRRLRSRATPSAPPLSLSVAGFAGPVARFANSGRGPNSPPSVPRLPTVAPSLRSGYGESGCRATRSVFVGYARSPL